MGGAKDSAVLGFPLLYAETQRFSLGVPRSFTIVHDGETVLFLRSASGTSPTLSLWAIDTATGNERIVVDPTSLDHETNELTAEERARRERARESAGGIVRYAVARSKPLATFVLAGSVYLADTTTARVRRVGTASPAFDARLSPDGQFIAYVC